MEVLHVERFRVDHLVRAGVQPIFSFRLGPDPPDFLALLTEGVSEVGLECTRLTDAPRLEALAQVDDLRGRLVTVSKSRLAPLHNTEVLVHFFEEDGPERPFKRSDMRAAELVDTILSLDPSRAAVADGPPPPTAPNMFKTIPSGGAAAGAWPLDGSHRPSTFMVSTGFELTLGYSTMHTETSVRERIRQGVARKDKPNNHLLLITAGGPDNRGEAHPAEEAIAGLITEDVEAIGLTTEFLEKVILHRWSVGDAWELFPEPKMIVEPGSRRVAGARPPTYTYPALPHTGQRMERNHPCLCGSGKKAKYCHLRESE